MAQIRSKLILSPEGAFRLRDFIRTFASWGCFGLGLETESYFEDRLDNASGNFKAFHY